MLKKIIILLVVVIIPIYSTELDTLWTKTFGGTENDVANQVIKTFDGCFLICGTTNSFGSGEKDGWLIKTNGDGETLWTKTYGGEGNDEFNSMLELQDSSILICGSYDVPTEIGIDGWIVKVDQDGEVLWNFNYGTLGNPEYFNKIIKTNDNGYIACGSTYKDKNSSSMMDEEDGYVLKINNDGDSLWSFRYTNGSGESFKSIVSTSDNGFLIGGQNSELHFEDPLLLKIGSNGNVESLKSSLISGGCVNEIAKTESEEIILCGDGKLVSSWGKKISQGYDTLWSQFYEVPEQNVTESVKSFSFYHRDSLVFCGYAGDNAWVFTADENGNMINSTTFGDLSSYYMLTSVINTERDKFIAVGSSYYENNRDAKLVCLSLSSSTSIENIISLEKNNLSIEVRGNFISLNGYNALLRKPNAFLYNIQGRECKNLTNEFRNSNNVVELKGLANGLYILKLFSDKDVISCSVLINR